MMRIFAHVPMTGFEDKCARVCSFRSSCAPPNDSGRHLLMTLECPAKCRFRAIAEAIGHLAQAQPVLANPAAGEMHPPPCYILHRGHAHQPREALGEDRSRQVDLCREGSDAPGFLGPAMDPCQCTSAV